LLATLTVTANGHKTLISQLLVQQILTTIGHPDWIVETQEGGSAIEVHQALTATGSVSIHEFGAWVLGQERYVEVMSFMDQYFNGFIIRERQHSKVRFEVPKMAPDGGLRRLSDMFSLLESHKEALFIAEYSVSQTSLEQIFNYFASQQEEETGDAVGIVKT